MVVLNSHNARSIVCRAVSDERFDNPVSVNSKRDRFNSIRVVSSATADNPVSEKSLVWCMSSRCNVVRVERAIIPVFVMLWVPDRLRVQSSHRDARADTPAFVMSSPIPPLLNRPFIDHL